MRSFLLLLLQSPVMPPIPSTLWDKALDQTGGVIVGLSAVYLLYRVMNAQIEKETKRAEEFKQDRDRVIDVIVDVKEVVAANVKSVEANTAAVNDLRREMADNQRGAFRTARQHGG